ncbi:MAG: MFS transporter, partial [Planctomycetota bacterium]|nr:MFS transporter [Planctomycetota bacterium]
MAGESKDTRSNLGYLAFVRANPLFLGFGFTLTFFSSFGQTYFVSTFGDSIRATFDLTEAEWGASYGGATAAAGVLLVWVGRYIDRFDLRAWTAGVVCALTSACLLMAWTPGAVFLVVSLFAMRLAGQGLMGHTSVTSMTRYFEAERARAATIAGLGFAAGFALFPRFGGWLQTQMDWRDAWLLLGGVAFAVLLPVSLTLLRGHAARHRAWVERAKAKPDGVVTPASTHQWTRGQVLADWRMWCLLPAALSSPFLLTGMIFFYRELARSKGWTPEHLELAMPFMGLALYVTSLLLGPLTDRVGARRVVVFAPLPLGLAMVVLGLFDHHASAYAYVILAGVAMGGMG